MKKNIIILTIIYIVYVLILLSLIIFGSDKYYQTYINAFCIFIGSFTVLFLTTYIVDKDIKLKNKLIQFSDKFFK